VGRAVAVVVVRVTAMVRRALLARMTAMVAAGVHAAKQARLVRTIAVIAMVADAVVVVAQPVAIRIAAAAVAKLGLLGTDLT
jgi:hypothetical protein